MWHIERRVYNGIVYLYPLCMSAHSCTGALVLCAHLKLCTVHMLFSYFQLLWLQVSTSMTDLCFDVFGIAKEKKDPKSIKGNRGIYTLC
jgi:hypothetical protein